MNTYLAGCLHFGHHNLYGFTDAADNPIRPYADNPDDGDEYVIERWNEIVDPQDRVYVTGDAVIAKKALSKLDRLNGRLILVKGNHDKFKLKDYLPYFDDIRAETILDKFIVTHRPMHPDSFPPWCLANVHAHTHSERVKCRNENGDLVEDPRYFNTSLECIDFRPISLNQIKSRFADKAA